MRNSMLLNIKNAGSLWLLLVMMLIISSCKLGEKYQQPEVKTEGLYRGVEDIGNASMADIPWQDLFKDEYLQKLITEGLGANLDLAIATARIDAASATLLQSKGAQLPNFNINGSSSFSKLANTPSVATGFATSQYQLYGRSSWELDIWGKLRGTKRAALASLLSSEAYRRAVQTQLVADIANNYYQLLALDKQLAITERTVNFRKEYEVTVGALKDAAAVTGADLMQSKANRYAAEVMIPDLKKSIREVENALSVLLGRVPGPIDRSTLEQQELGASLMTGVPALLLSNRPDVQRAEYNLRSNFEMVKVARSYFYPQITLTGTTGLASRELSTFFDPTSVFANLAAGLVQPVFNNNVNKARLRAQEASRQEALATYQKVMLTAGQEVSNALYSYDAANAKLNIRMEQVNALQNAVDYNQELLQYSSASYVDVLTSQQNLLSAQLSQVSDQLQQMQAVVNLYRSLGGGWK